MESEGILEEESETDGDTEAESDASTEAPRVRYQQIPGRTTGAPNDEYIPKISDWRPEEELQGSISWFRGGIIQNPLFHVGREVFDLVAFNTLPESRHRSYPPVS
ncbi:hypothetical protein E1301_Tti024175 [Triplophysa tibetana]|uniref:Uncharacterized protein n=1 Tax=Triplophysa tibetana TaxID=1572043 RepID=A0A5A9MX34_9TELE|nr:hypothetical protein E1301_Tti024175 [Triplophysa tibetana]